MIDLEPGWGRGIENSGCRAKPQKVTLNVNQMVIFEKSPKLSFCLWKPQKRDFFKIANVCTYGGVKVTTNMYGGYEMVLGGVDIANLP